nr:MAG TPA: hypothetical protein [Caudoviricetes sp.]
MQKLSQQNKKLIYFIKIQEKFLDFLFFSIDK